MCMTGNKKKLYGQLARNLSRHFDYGKKLSKGFKFLGKGLHRKVYVHKKAPGVVFKHCFGVANAREWRFWEKYKNTKKGKYLIPCIFKESSVIVQKRAILLTKICKNSDVMCRISDGLERKFPQLYDVHWNNVGWYEDRYVIIDYAM